MRKMLRIGIIGGFGGQGKRMAGFLYEDIDVEYVFYEHSSKYREIHSAYPYVITKDLSEMLTCEGVIIASPTNTHFCYLEYLYSNQYAGYIFCEKPPVKTIEEVKRLRSFQDEWKKKVMFGFNLRHSIYEDVLNYNFDIDLGELRYCSIISGHGLGFKDIYPLSWRNSYPEMQMGVFETVGIHYLDLFMNHYGIPEKTFFNATTKAPKGNVYDNAVYEVVFQNGIYVNMFLSYTTPMIQESKFVFENAIVVVSAKDFDVFYPRDTFDANGLFAAPGNVLHKESKDGFWRDSQRKIVHEFFSKIYEGTGFDKNDFEKSLNVCEFMMELERAEVNV